LVFHCQGAFVKRFQICLKGILQRGTAIYKLYRLYVHFDFNFVIYTIFYTVVDKIFNGDSKEFKVTFKRLIRDIVCELMLFQIEKIFGVVNNIDQPVRFFSIVIFCVVMRSISAISLMSASSL